MPSVREHIHVSEVIGSSVDNELVQRALARDGDAFRIIMQKYSRRIYRIARGIVRNECEAEDVVQEVFMSAFIHLGSFRGDSSLPTWLVRIGINKALGRLRARRQTVDNTAFEPNQTEAKIMQVPPATASDDPERAMARRQILQLVEKATDSLPEIYRIVFITRVIEGMSVEDTAEMTGIRVETVKTRLHRARRLLRARLNNQIGPIEMDAFPFAAQQARV
jgi:RNA polymerase sigma-70 factor, ECF subfamily